MICTSSRLAASPVAPPRRPRAWVYVPALVLAAALASPPRAAEADQIDEGRGVYDDYCATCHGRDMVAAGGLTYDLRQFPKDEAERFRTSVLDGKGAGMPAWRDRIGDDELAALWAYVRSGGN
jgi:mono/diheme cytochrome c family protein